MKELMDYLPEWYRESRETAAVQEALQPEMTALWEGRDDLLLQLDPQTATWGLDLWEAALGLRAGRDQAVSQRRAAVIAKLRGRETTTPALIREISEALLGVPVTVSEIYSGYRVEICFDAQGELPAGLEDLRRQLDQIMPAHLTWDFLITMAPTLHVGGAFTSWHVVTLPALS